MDADKLAQAALQRGTPAWKAIVDTFGAEILKSNGKIDRQALGARVFENPEALRQLEAILHPAVGEIIKQSLRQTQSPVVVVEAIKLFEANLHLWCDALWVVTAAPQVQLERVMRDRQMSADDARARLDAQSSSEEKLRRANVVIDNSGDLDSTLRQVQTAWQDTVRLDQARDKTEWLYGIVSAQPIAPPLPPEPPAPDCWPAAGACASAVAAKNMDTNRTARVFLIFPLPFNGVESDACLAPTL